MRFSRSMRILIITYSISPSPLFRVPEQMQTVRGGELLAYSDVALART